MDCICKGNYYYLTLELTNLHHIARKDCSAALGFEPVTHLLVDDIQGLYPLGHGDNRAKVYAGWSGAALRTEHLQWVED